MVKNNLFTIVTMASLCASMSYGTWSTYSTKNNLILQNDYNADEFYIFDKKTHQHKTSMFFSVSPQIEQKSETDELQRIKIAKLPQPRSFKTGYGLAFLPQYSPLKHNLTLLCKDPQNVEDLKTIARYLESKNLLQNIKKEGHLSHQSWIASIKAPAALIQSKMIESNIDKSHQDVVASAKRLISKLPQSQQNQALKDLDKAVENAQHNRFQSKRYT